MRPRRASTQIHSQVAVPIDEIVCDATFVTERLDSVDPELRARLEQILASARGIKDVIQKVGRTLAPTDAVPARRSRDDGQAHAASACWSSMATSRFARAAHTLLEPHDCVVETAQRGSEAESLFRHGLRDLNYHAVISGVKLPDMSGYELMMRLKPMVQPRAADPDAGIRLGRRAHAGQGPRRPACTPAAASSSRSKSGSCSTRWKRSSTGRRGGKA